LNKHILNTVNQNFINENLDSDSTSLLFKKPTLNKVTIKELVEQIEAKKKCKIKLQTWFNASQIYYPNKLNIEQTSSELTAKYKADLVSGNSLIDLTGGFGVDCYYFSNKIKNITHCEANKELSELVQHNFKQLGKSEITTIAGDSINYLKEQSKQYDWIYVDPSRRHETKGKVFFLKDCEPNVPKHLDLLFTYTDNILIKTAPLLDISVGLNELHAVKEVHVVAVNNEVKELLWLLSKNSEANNPVINTINFKNKASETFSFTQTNEKDARATYSEPLKYIYEPNSAVLKAGAFKLLSSNYAIFKLDINSHLYTSNELIDFPGRRFEIKEWFPYKKKLVKKKFKHQKANITTRNFPQTVKQLRKEFDIKDGGDNYVFFTTTKDHQKMVLVCSKVLLI